MAGIGFPPLHDCEASIAGKHGESYSPLPTIIERQRKHNHQCEQVGNEKGRPLVCLKNRQAVDGLFVVLNAWEFESCAFPHRRQNLRLTIVIRRFCSRLVKLHQNQDLKLAVITYCKCRQADLRGLALF